MTTLIKNAHVVTAVDNYTADILIEGNCIHTISSEIPVGEGVEVLDANGLLTLMSTHTWTGILVLHELLTLLGPVQKQQPSVARLPLWIFATRPLEKEIR